MTALKGYRLVIRAAVIAGSLRLFAIVNKQSAAGRPSPRTTRITGRTPGGALLQSLLRPPCRFLAASWGGRDFLQSWVPGLALLTTVVAGFRAPGTL
jgi:hypothetical protein